MKKISIAFTLLFIGNHLIAQSGMFEEIVINSAPKAKFLYETEIGFVYALPQDNMPCLVPKIKSNMPTARSEVPGYIPNSLLKKGQSPTEIIPLNISPLSFPNGIYFQNQKSFLKKNNSSINGNK